MSKLFLKNSQHLATKKSLKEELKTEWVLPRETIDTDLLNHFILYWSASFFQRRYNILEGTIFFENRIFNVKFHKCTEADVLLLESSKEQVVLSFRVPLAKTGINPIVLVSCNKAAMNDGAHRVHNHKSKDGKFSQHSHIKVKKGH